jgi:alginate O-acetyltransferase complex protein AlgI
MRWHMSLTGWCRDYVFRPVTALSRSALIGLFAAMLAVALWHEFSGYYVLWAAWQVLGVVLTRLAMGGIRFDRAPSAVAAVFGPLIVLGWLSLARPVLTRLLELAS